MPLAIGRGICAGVSVDKRTYKMCTNTDEDIEDEIHFLFSRDLFDDVREILFKKILEAIPDFANILILDMLRILFNGY